MVNLKRFACVLGALCFGAGAALLAGAAHAQSDALRPGAPLELQAPQVRSRPVPRVAKKSIAEERRRTEALNDLSSHGYTDFRDFRREGAHFLATVHRGNRDIVVEVDPRADKITEQP